MVLCAFAKEGCNGTSWKVVHEVHALLERKIRRWVLESESTHVQKIPSNVGLLSKTQDAFKVPELAALRVFYDEVSALGDLVESYLHTELHHW